MSPAGFTPAPGSSSSSRGAEDTPATPANLQFAIDADEERDDLAQLETDASDDERLATDRTLGAAGSDARRVTWHGSAFDKPPASADSELLPPPPAAAAAGTLLPPPPAPLPSPLAPSLRVPTPAAAALGPAPGNRASPMLSPSGRSADSLTGIALEAAARQACEDTRQLRCVVRTRKEMQVREVDSVAALLQDVLEPVFAQHQLTPRRGSGASESAHDTDSMLPASTPTANALDQRSPRVGKRRGRVKPGVAFPPMQGSSIQNTPEELLIPPASGRSARMECWVDLQGLEEADLKLLGAALNLDELTIEDMVCEDCPEKLETFSDRPVGYQYSFIRGHFQVGQKCHERGVSCILYPRLDLFITVHKQPVCGIAGVYRRIRFEFLRREYGHSHPVLATGQKRQKVRKMQPLWLFYAVLDGVVDSLRPRALVALQKAGDVDELVLQLCSAGANSGATSEMDDMQRCMTEARKLVSELRRVVVPKDALISANRLGGLATFRDIQDNIAQMLEQLDSARDQLAQAASNHIAHASFEAAMGANATNEVMKKLSIMAALFVPMTLVCSLFGMNVRVPGQGVDSTWPFWGIVGAFTLTFFGFYFWFRPRHSRGGG